MITDAILNTQKFVLSASPGLLPLAALGFSALNSWHCSFMCGAYAVGVGVGEKQMQRLLAVRIVAYTGMGALMGFGGRLLVQALEFQILNVLAFAVFMAVTVFCVLPNLVPGLAKFSLSLKIPMGFKNKMGPSFSGLMFAVTPCHLLTFYYGLAATTGSVWMGGALLFGHAVMTSPALAYAPTLTSCLSKVSPFFRSTLRLVILAIVILHACYFIGRLLDPGGAVYDRILFCF